MILPPLPVPPPDPDPAAQEMWDAMLDEVSGEINAPSLRVWFEGTVPTVLDGHGLTISVPNSFAKDYIETRFLEVLQGALRQRTVAPEAVVEIVVQPD